MITQDGTLLQVPAENKYILGIGMFAMQYQCNVQYHSERDGRFRVHVINTALRNKLKTFLEQL